MALSYKLHHSGTKQGSSLTLTDYIMALSYKLHHSGTKQGSSLTLTDYTMAHLISCPIVGIRQGRPGTDYPVLASVPYTNFYCDEQPYPGFFADTESRCQAWHYCDIDGRQATFLCPNGTQFSQFTQPEIRTSISPSSAVELNTTSALANYATEANTNTLNTPKPDSDPDIIISSPAVFVCDWWFNVRCDLSEALYVINTRLYGTPRENPARPHRVITKELLQNIFLK
uniref:Chitin-binding type-2 domain-containing protein n=1 Tax=Timema poppense TaxID=170557 RepID=A0A7R9HAF6_TIMPO|nr:unnamed protein product [Timema poppensis]